MYIAAQKALLFKNKYTLIISELFIETLQFNVLKDFLLLK